MNVNGDLNMGEGSQIYNLTLPSGTSFPANGNNGEQFYLTTALDADTPKGEYEHDGTAWVNKPTLVTVKQMIAALPVVKTYKTIGVANVGHNVVTVGNSIFTNHAVSRISAGLTVGQPLPGIWIDPADYPAGTKLKFHIHMSVNNAGSSNSWTFGLRRITRPASGGGTGVVIYSLDATILGSTTVAGPQTANADKDVESAEFDMPATAGLYGFAYSQGGPSSANSVHQMTAELKAYY